MSSQSFHDFLEFYIDGTLQSRIAGTLNLNWTRKTNSIAAGLHTVEWRYTKDASISSGADAGWVDQVSYIQAPSIVTTNSSLGISNGIFNFSISAAANQVVVIETSTNLLDWKPLQTNLQGGSFSFSDPQ